VTAGPDERTLRVVPGGGPESEQEAEDRIREELHRRGVGPGGPASSPPPMPLHPPTIPAQPDAEAGEPAGRTDPLPEWWRVRFPRPTEEEATEEAPARLRATNDRLPSWWDRRKGDLADQAADEEEPGEEPEDDEEEPEPKGRGPRPGRRRVSKEPAEDGDGDEDDEPDDDEDGDGKTKGKKAKGKKGGKGRKAKGEEEGEEGPRWSRPDLGRPPGLPTEKHNLFTWWRGMEPHTKWLLYHGTGLGAGLYLGVPAYGYEGHRFIADNPAGDPEVWATWGLLGLLLVADYRVRNLFPLIAWAVRALSTSVIIGALWYSAPLTH
jgi:hypothetical protein